MKPLDGITVLDLTRLLPGAVTTMILSNFGAEVIKIEDPERGDYAREMPPFIGNVGAYFLMTNSGKKSIALNLRDARGKRAFLRLVERADVLIESFRPGVMQRLDLSYEDLREKNEALIYAALTGYGQTGPYAKAAGHDINYLSLAGALDILGAKHGPPAIPGIQLADLAGGAMPAVIGILLALASRAKTGKGQMVDVSMFDGVMSLLHVPLAHFVATGQPPGRGSELLTGRYACYNVYEARDGRSVSVGALERKFWATLCRVLGCEQFVADQYAEGERQTALITALASIFKTRDAREWAQLFEVHDACVTMAKNIEELMQDAHVHARDMLPIVQHASLGGVPRIGVVPKLSQTPGQASGAVPLLGQHTTDQLLAAGVSSEDIEEMEREQIIRVTRAPGI